MSSNRDPVFPPGHLLACPNCGSGTGSGLNLAELRCNTCNSQHFAIGSTPCFFPGGVHHQAVWRHQVAAMQVQGKQSLAQLQEAMSRYDLTDTGRLRLLDTYEASQQSQQAVINLLSEAGLAPEFQQQMAQSDQGDLAEYFDLILRDWAWGDEPNRHFDVSENSAALNRALSVLPEEVPCQHVLILGAGAGRLGWDLHNRLDAGCTVALDSNPLLLVAAEKLVKRQEPIALSGRGSFPQIDCPVAGNWQLTVPKDRKERRATWHPLGANVWRMPFKPGSFDLIVTPWFIDVNGGDVRDLIGLIAQLLTPNGRWLNTGPLLFTRHLPFHLKYQADEIKEFLTLAGFELERERVDETVHLASPLEVRSQHEQLWTFCARGPAGPDHSAPLEDVDAPWLLMHHLPIPRQDFSPHQEHPLIDAVLSLVDGTRSINAISHAVAPHLPDGMAPKDVVVTLLGQLLAEKDGSDE